MKKLVAGIMMGAIGVLSFAGGAAVTAKPQRLIGGVEAQERVSKLTSEVPWYTNLDQAKLAAARQGKMVLWVHMLGNLNGKT